MKYFLLFCFLLLAFRFFYFFSNKPQYQEGQVVNFELTLLDEPKSTIFNQTFYVNGIKIIAGKYPGIHYGDGVRLKGVIKKAAVFSKEKSGVIKKNEIFIVKNPSIEPVPARESKFLSLAYAFRQKVFANFSQVLAKPDADLLMGIVFGVKVNFDRNFYENLKRVGLMHVIAASGMNVSMVGGFFEAFFILFLRRRAAVVFSALGVIFYWLVSGFSAPILRAVLMMLAFYLGSLFGRKNYSYFILFLVCWLLLFINPDFINDIGFRLSFLSTLGIISIKPIFADLLAGKQFSFFSVFSEDFFTTLSAQIATLPIMLVSFSSYNPISIFANAFVLWTVPCLMILGGIASIFSLFFVFIAKIMLLISLPFLWFLKLGVSVFSGISWQVNIDNLPVILIFGYYLILLSLALFFNRQRNLKMVKSGNSKIQFKHGPGIGRQ